MNEVNPCWLLTALKILEHKPSETNNLSILSFFLFFRLCLHPEILAWVSKDDIKDYKIVMEVLPD